ncbi:MAG: class I SAM-dependent methyltransferase [Candidatus Hodarchaeota archaeon]
MNKKRFYEEHKNFSQRTLNEYFLSPGIRCKFDLLKENLNLNDDFKTAIDIGCSGNSFLYLFNNSLHKSFFDLANFPLKQYSSKSYLYPVCGDILQLPYRADSFDFVSALDVLEHIKDDQIAVSEISRILKKNGITVVTVPHKMKYYTCQDKLIGHYRRYEINQVKGLFKKYNLKTIKFFGIYGQLMRVADIQSSNPKEFEKKILKLRNRYEANTIFRNIWNILVKIMAKIMKLDAKYHSLNKIMNIAFIFIKE